MIVHVTGPMINVKGRVVQRCPLCGAKLYDSESSSGFSYPEGRLLSVEAGDPTVYDLLSESTCVSEENSCMEFI